MTASGSGRGYRRRHRAAFAALVRAVGPQGLTEDLVEATVDEIVAIFTRACTNDPTGDSGVDRNTGVRDPMARGLAILIARPGPSPGRSGQMGSGPAPAGDPSVTRRRGRGLLRPSVGARERRLPTRPFYR